MSLFYTQEVQEAIEAIDRAGRDAPKEQWVDLCEEVSSYFEAAAEAARDELRADSEG